MIHKGENDSSLNLFTETQKSNLRNPERMASLLILRAFAICVNVSIISVTPEFQLLFQVACQHTPLENSYALV